MPATRLIEDIQETSIGVIARSNDGRAYRYTVESGSWVELPALPQDGYVDPIPGMFGQLGNGFQDLQKMMETLHGHGAPRRVGGPEMCPVDNCGFTGTVAEVTSHMQFAHVEPDPEDKR